MVEKTYFRADTAVEKRAEVYKFCEQLGLSPERALIRIFNAGLMDAMQTFGTDRAGIDEVDTRPYNPDEGWGYAELLKNRGLKLEDGLYAMPLSQWASFAGLLFNKETLSIPSHHAAIAVYDGDKMLDIFDNQPSSARVARGDQEGEFYYFKDPSQKQDALAGILVQPPTQLDTVFHNLPTTEEKIAFIGDLLPDLNKESQYFIQQFIMEINRDVQRKIYTAQQKNNIELQQQLNQLRQQIGILSTDCLQRTSEVAFIEECNESLYAYIIEPREKGREPRGTLVDYLTQTVQDELNQEIREDYRAKLLQFTSKLQALISPEQDKQKQQPAIEKIAVDVPPQTSHDFMEKLIDFAKKLPAPEQQKENKTLDQNAITGSSGLEKPPIPPGKSSHDTPHRS